MSRQTSASRHDSYSTPGLPERPWCSNHSHGRYPRVLPKADARRCRYIQPQPQWVRVWLNFDYDRDDAWCAADEVELPAPTLTVINPENGHGHLAYGLAVPVPLGPENKERLKRYLAAIERAIAVRLGADLNYRGLTCKKNPTDSQRGGRPDLHRQSTFRLVRLYWERDERRRVRSGENPAGRRWPRQPPSCQPSHLRRAASYW